MESRTRLQPPHYSGEYPLQKSLRLTSSRRDLLMGESFVLKKESI